MIRINEASGLDVSRIGGKGLRLAQLMAAGHRVKPGFIIETDDVTEILQGGQIPEGLIALMDEQLDIDTFGAAVRSSAHGEDGGQFAFPGMYDTRLNVARAEIVEAILECVRGADSMVAAAYADQTGAFSGRLALVVQEMVRARSAGVLFTVDPMDAGHSGMVIEAVAGLGEDLVSGRREPRRYYVTDEGRLTSVEGADEPQLSDEQLIELVRVASQIRDQFGVEQDIEWAFDQDGQLWINQSRDVTVAKANGVVAVRSRVIDALAGHTERELDRLRSLGLDVSGDVYSDQNIAEILTPHPTLMASGLFNFEFAHGQGGIRTGRNQMGYAVGNELETGFQLLVGGQPRCSIVHDALTYRIDGIPLDEYSRMVQYYLDRIVDDPRLANYPEVHLYEQNPSRELLAEIFGTGRADAITDLYDHFFAGIRMVEMQAIGECRDEFLPRWDGFLEQQQAMPETGELSQLVQRYQVLAHGLRDDACRMFVKAARLGFFVYARLTRMLQEMTGDQAEANLAALTSGIPLELNPNLQFNLELAALAEGRTSLDSVLARFGHLAVHELEISVPRFKDDSTALVEMAERVQVDPGQQEAMVDRFERVQARLLAGAGSRRKELATDIQVARTYLPLRELVKFQYLRAYAMMRDLSLQIERQLGWKPGLIFNLNPEEVFGIRSGNVAGMEDLALAREEFRQASRGLYVPPVIFSDQLDAIGRLPDDDGGKILRGIGVTDQVCEGKVVVVDRHDNQEAFAQLRAGCVLVTKTTDPAWVPMLGIVGSTGGLVTEVGGVLAHGAIYAREANMAAVLNVPGATQRLETGMTVRVNGPQGCVEILS